MLQRKQTLFLLAAIIVTAVCLCQPIGAIEPQGMGIWTAIYSLFVTGPEVSFNLWPLFVLLVLTYPVTIIAIALYKKRKAQARLCVWAVVCNVLWYAYFLFGIFTAFQQIGTFHVKFAAGLPLINIILYLLARKGIMDDERLVRSADRIR